MDNIHIVNLSTYNKPKVVEDKRKEWVAYGDDNNYYKYLIDLFTSSTTNNAVINGISNMIYGKGLDALDSSTKTDEYAALKSIFNNDCLKKIALDLKLLGEACFQVLYQNGKVIKAEHFPRQTLRPEKMNEEGDIEAYYYAPDWEKVKQNTKLKKIANFGYGNGTEPEIKVVKKYVSGYDYICPVDYQGALAYCELESEISDFLINDVQCNFSGTKVVNFNNGVPDREKQLQIKSEVMAKLTGSRGEKVIVAFNNNAESKTTVDDIPLDDAPAHYEYLANECIRKILMGHRVTSPLLLGVRDGNSGLGNNADEIKTASLLFNNITIKPYQDQIIECIKHILAVNEISLKLYFRTLQPLEFINTDNAVTQEAKEEETGVKLVSQVVDKDFAIIDDRLAYSTPEKAEEMAKNIGCEGIHTHEYIDVDGNTRTWYMPCEKHIKDDLKKCPKGFVKDKNGKCVRKKSMYTEEELAKDERPFLSDDDGDELFTLIDQLGEIEDLENYELLDTDTTEDEPEDFDVENYLNGLKLSAKQDSTQDNDLFKVRYKYVKGTKRQAKGETRPFCRRMLSTGKLYRKEDIAQMSFRGVNKQHGHKGQNYSLFKWQGGVNCHHIWERRIYKKKLKKDGTPYKGNALANTRFVNVNQAVKQGFKLPKNPKEVAQANITRGDKGHHPNYKG